jgi:hypothetical protein
MCTWCMRHMEVGVGNQLTCTFCTCHTEVGSSDELPYGSHMGDTMADEADLTAHLFRESVPGQKLKRWR